MKHLQWLVMVGWQACFWPWSTQGKDLPSGTSRVELIRCGPDQQREPGPVQPMGQGPAPCCACARPDRPGPTVLPAPHRWRGPAGGLGRRRAQPPPGARNLVEEVRRIDPGTFR